MDDRRCQMPEIKFGGNTATTFVEEVMMRLIVTTCNLEHPKQPTSPPSDHFHSPARSQLYPTGPGSPSKGLEILNSQSDSRNTTSCLRTPDAANLTDFREPQQLHAENDGHHDHPQRDAPRHYPKQCSINELQQCSRNLHEFNPHSH